jgi:tetratricopeptide (TPR) repeat protein
MGQSKDERVMSLLDSFLEGRGESADDASVLGAVPMDYVSAYLDTPSDTPDSQADKAIRTKSEQLLDAFLASDNEKPSFRPIPSDVQSPADEGEDENDTEPLDDTYFTETLARIYLKQRRYDKALEIIRSLYLNFPNKSIYFADQIRYLEKLVRINQN